MSSNQQTMGNRKFFAKQVLLLVITVLLVVYFTIPLMKAFGAALSPGELVENVSKVTRAIEGLQTKQDVVRSKLLMRGGDDEAQERLKKEVEELKRQIAAKELENKHLQEQMALVRAIMEGLKRQPSPATVPVVDTGSKIVDLVTKILGCIGSIFSGAMFVVSWWRKRRESPQLVAS